MGVAPTQPLVNLLRAMTYKQFQRQCTMLGRYRALLPTFRNVF